MSINSNSNKSINTLHPHQALILANRWAKLKDAHPSDIKKLYSLRDKILTSWIAEGTVIMSRVICRESETIESMKEAINANYTLLDHLNYDRWQKDKKSEKVKYWKIMESIACDEGDGVAVPLPQIEQDRLSEIYNKNLRAHKQAKKEVREKSKHNNKFENSESVDRLSIKTIPPRPIKPELFTIMSFEECLELKSPEIVQALDWARLLLNRPELSILDIDFDLVSEIEQAILEEDLEFLKNKAHVIFHQTINRHLEPIEVYEQLTALNLDYSGTLGLECHQDRYG